MAMILMRMWMVMYSSSFFDRSDMDVSPVEFVPTSVALEAEGRHMCWCLCVFGCESLVLHAHNHELAQGNPHTHARTEGIINLLDSLGLVMMCVLQ